MRVSGVWDKRIDLGHMDVSAREVQLWMINQTVR